MRGRIGIYTDQELDTETGLYNYDARMYDPLIGRFISPDSMVPDLYDPQSLNRYSYTRNNPLKYTDPSGHILISGTIAAIGYGLSVYGPEIAATALAYGIFHYAKPIAEDIGKYLRGMLLKNEEIRENTQRGRETEKEHLEKLGREKNTERITSEEGTSIPDYMDDERIGEIKDTKRLSDTKQIRIQRGVAERKKQKHIVHVREDTDVSGNVERGATEVERDVNSKTEESKNETDSLDDELD